MRVSMASAVIEASAPMLCSIVRSPARSTSTIEVEVGSSESIQSTWRCGAGTVWWNE